MQQVQRLLLDLIILNPQIIIARTHIHTHTRAHARTNARTHSDNRVPYPTPHSDNRVPYPTLSQWKKVMFLPKHI